MDNCTLCDSNVWQEYCKINNGSQKVLIYEFCTFCKLDPLPSDEQLDEFYANTYRKTYSNQPYVTQKVINYEQARANRVINIVKPYFKSKYKNILDVGCSTGTLLKSLECLSLEPVLFGLEKNNNYRNFLISNNILSSENLLTNDIKYYAESVEEFDFISMVHVLEHLREPIIALNSINKMLSDDGIFYVEVPNLKTPYNNLKKQYFAIYHLYYFTDYTLKLALEKAGFKIIKSEKVAKTSICYVCKKASGRKMWESGPSDARNRAIFSNNQFLSLIKRLKNYQLIHYPLLLTKAYIIKFLIFLGIKDNIKKMFGKI